jgi:hypothetical protein
VRQNPELLKITEETLQKQSKFIGYSLPDDIVYTRPNPDT